jgi:hypothetical protein
MEEQLISLDTAKLAKEKGFDEPSRKGYMLNGETDSFCFNETRKNSTLNKDKYERNDFVCVAPTQSLLQKWLREVHNIDILVDSVGGVKGYYYCIQDIKTGDKLIEWNYDYSIYEEALEKGLQEALKLIK